MKDSIDFWYFFWDMYFSYKVRSLTKDYIMLYKRWKFLPLCSGWQRWILEKWHCYYLLVLASVNPLVGLWSVGQPWNVYNNIFLSLISILLSFSSFFQLWAHLSNDQLEYTNNDYIIKVLFSDIKRFKHSALHQNW